MSEVISPDSIRCPVYLCLLNFQWVENLFSTRRELFMFFTNFLFAKPCIAAYLLLLISGCGPKEPEFVPGSLGGVNHTSDAVNWYSVNGWGVGMFLLTACMEGELVVYPCLWSGSLE
jgi:hypothetical protein